jgi:hypothetical protein
LDDNDAIDVETITSEVSRLIEEENRLEDMHATDIDTGRNITVHSTDITLTACLHNDLLGCGASCGSQITG